MLTWAVCISIPFFMGMNLPSSLWFLTYRCQALVVRGSEQAALDEAFPANCRGFELVGLERSLPTQNILILWCRVCRLIRIIKWSPLEGLLEVTYCAQSRPTPDLLWLQLRLVPSARAVWYSPVHVWVLLWMSSSTLWSELLTCICPSHLDCERRHLRDQNREANSHHRRCWHRPRSGNSSQLPQATLQTARESVLWT